MSPQCGCESGQKCGIENGQPEVCESIGTTPRGGACSADSDCGLADACVFDVCEEVCTTTCSDAGFECLAIYGAAGEPLGYSACAPHCDLLDPTMSDAQHTACTSAQNCLPSSHTPGATTCVTSTGNGAAGTTCTADSDCAPGLGCEPAAAGDTTGLCTAYCIVGQSGCPSGQSCIPYTTPVIVDGSTFGVCLTTSGSTGNTTSTSSGGGSGGGGCPDEYPVACPGGLCCPTEYPACGGDCGYKCCPYASGGGSSNSGGGGTSGGGGGTSGGGVTCVSGNSCIVGSPSAGSCGAGYIALQNGCGVQASCHYTLSNGQTGCVVPTPGDNDCAIYAPNGSGGTLGANYTCTLSDEEECYSAIGCDL